MKLNDYLAARGKVNELAALIGVPPALLSQWKVGSRQVPAERCPCIEEATQGVVTCEELRNDVNWAAIRKLGAGRTAKKLKKAA